MRSANQEQLYRSLLSTERVRISGASRRPLTMPCSGVFVGAYRASETGRIGTRRTAKTRWFPRKTGRPRRPSMPRSGGAVISGRMPQGKETKATSPKGRGAIAAWLGRLSRFPIAFTPLKPKI